MFPVLGLVGVGASGHYVVKLFFWGNSKIQIPQNFNSALKLGSGCRTVAEQTLGNREVVGLNPTWSQAFPLLITSVMVSLVRPLEEVQH